MSDLLHLLRHELRNATGTIPAAAIALCKVFQHQLDIRDLANSDLRGDWRKQGERIGRLEEKVKRLVKEDSA